MPNVLVTGSSAGLGKAAVRLFAAKGWQVAATMRSPAKESELGQVPGVSLFALDVTDAASVQAAMAAAIEKLGHLDVVVNNAGYGLSGPFESLTAEQIRRQFDTNVFGLMEVARAVLPHFRARQAGTLVNVASMGGRITLPLYSPYHSTKWAVEGFSESLAYELRPFGIRVKIVEPGVIRTDFYDRSADTAAPDDASPYAAYAKVVMANMTPGPNSGVTAEQAAATIVQAAGDPSDRMRYVVGKDAKQLLLVRRLLPDGLYRRVVRSVVEKGVPG